MLNKLTKLVTRFPKSTIAFFLVATIFFAIQFPKIKIDTDPENMLTHTQPDRVFYDKVKKEFGIRDLLVVGIVNEKGIFNGDTLNRIANVTNQILGIKGVIIEDVVSLNTSDNITSEEGVLIVKKGMDEKDLYGNPFYVDKIISRDGKATAIYIPIEKKDQSYRISKEIEEILRKELTDEEEFYIAGLPVAEDTFGHEMFVQMGITAPLAGFFIMLLIFFIFRSWACVIPPMLDAMLSVIWTMGLLIGLGFTVHIMSSMIPIFLMPIALLDDIHVLSGFFDRYLTIRDKRKTLIATMKDLYRPMFFTSITSAVGFASLAMADIPPVRVFGFFVAFGIMTAWLFTHTIVPAIIMLMNENKLAAFLEKRRQRVSFTDKILKFVGRVSFMKSKLILTISVITLAIGIVGIYQIQINDNPVKWFKPRHKIRVADNVMNRFFGGTYMAYLVVEGEEEDTIKRPEVMGYIDKLQGHLEGLAVVGKTSSVCDIVKRINYVLHDEDSDYNAVPKTIEEIGQYLFLFSMTGDPNDLDNFLDYTVQKANIWIQMKKGENISMREVKRSVDNFIKNNPLPAEATIKWSGLTYINMIWQNLMVWGMLKAVLGSFWVVFLLMAVEFRSIRVGFISMLPLTIAIVCSYGMVGIIGKEYDMPIAVCSALALGMAIDFAIHYLQRFKSAYREFKDLEAANNFMSGEPYRAILGNAIVVSLGFLPLITSTLTPYVTVGVFFGMLMIFSAITTLFLLPAIMKGCCRKIFACMLLILLSNISYGEENLIAKSRQSFYYAGNDMRAKVLMELINKDGQKRIRELTMLRKDYSEGGDQKYFMYFHKPSDVKDTAFMVYKYPNKDDDRWLFIPAINLVKRIAANDKYSSFVGSDFTYEDVSGRKPEEDNYTLLREEEKCYVIESIPKGPSEYTKRISWIDKTNFLPVREEFYDKQNELYREFSASEIKDINGIPTVTMRTMKNIKTGHRTEVTFSEIEYNLGIGDDVFTERYLRRPPSEWIK